MLEVLNVKSNYYSYSTYEVVSSWNKGSKEEISTDVFMVKIHDSEELSNGKQLIDLLVSPIAHYENDKVIPNVWGAVVTLTIICDGFSYHDIDTISDLIKQLFVQHYHKATCLSVEKYKGW